MGSESIATEVGAARLTQVEERPLSGQVSSNAMNKVCRPDWKFAMPVIQLLPTEGSPALRPRYSTELTCWPASVVLTGVKTPGAMKFSYPIFAPVSLGAMGIGVGVGVAWARSVPDTPSLN